MMVMMKHTRVNTSSRKRKKMREKQQHAVADGVYDQGH